MQRNFNVNFIKRLPGVSQVLYMPSVRKSLLRLFGAGHTAAWDRVHPFDIEHGTDTSGFVPVARLNIGPEAKRTQALPYGGSQPSIIRETLSLLPPLDSFVFVDLGCGKGRPLLVASEFPFRDIIGVELSAPLAKIARENSTKIAERFPKRTRIRIVVGDATRFQLPAGNLVLFLYNPFGDEAMKIVSEAIGNALKEEQRIVYVVYYNPVSGHRFDAEALLQRHFAVTMPYAAEEIGFGPDTEDPVVVWRGGGGAPSGDVHANARIEPFENNPLRVKLVQ